MGAGAATHPLTVLWLGLHGDAESVVAARLDLIEQPTQVERVLPCDQATDGLAIALVPLRWPGHCLHPLDDAADLAGGRPEDLIHGRSRGVARQRLVGADRAVDVHTPARSFGCE